MQNISNTKYQIQNISNAINFESLQNDEETKPDFNLIKNFVINFEN